MSADRKRACILALAAAAALFGGLGPTQAQQKVSVDGSTGTAPLVAALGKAYAAKAGVTVDVGKGLGTKARFEALANGKIDIAMASHGLNVAEVTGRGMIVRRIAMTPVVFGVHESVTVANLADAQICAIYDGSRRNWKELGGNDLAIAPLARPDSEVDMEVVRDGVSCFKTLKLPDGVRILPRAGDMAKALAETAGGVGMASTTVVEQSKGKIKAVALNGNAPTEANVLARTYRLTRDAFLVTGRTPSAQTKDFIDFVLTAAGASVIRANGAIPAAR
jgi:phosphate transport system substrate-binding protein